MPAPTHMPSIHLQSGEIFHIFVLRAGMKMYTVFLAENTN